MAEKTLTINTFDVGSRSYQELNSGKEFSSFLKKYGVTKNFVKPYLEFNGQGDGDFPPPWHTWIDTKGRNVGVMVLNHGGLESEEAKRLGLIFEIETNNIVTIAYWINTKTSSVGKKNLETI